jgi:hypothetical protein
LPPSRSRPLAVCDGTFSPHFRLQIHQTAPQPVAPTRHEVVQHLQARLTEVQGSSVVNHRYLGGDKSLSPRREYSQQSELSLAEEYLEDYLKLPAIPGAQKGGIRGSEETPLSSTLNVHLKLFRRNCLSSPFCPSTCRKWHSRFRCLQVCNRHPLLALLMFFLLLVLVQWCNSNLHRRSKTFGRGAWEAGAGT